MIGGDEARVAMQPSGEDHGLGQPPRLARKVAEYRLRHVLRRLGIAAELAPRRGEHQVDVTSDEFGKGGFVPALRIGSEQFGVVVAVIHFTP